MTVIHTSQTITIETHPKTGPEIYVELEVDAKGRNIWIVRSETQSEPLATISQKLNASTRVHFLQAKGGFFGIINTNRLTYLALPGSQLQLPDTLLNLLGDLPPGRINPDSSPKIHPQKIQQVTTQAMILGAGIASRFVPVSGELTGYAKPSVPLVGQDSVIVVLAKHLYQHGIRRILVNTFYMPDVLKKQLNQIDGLEVIYVDEEKPSGTAGGLLKALERGLVIPDEPILIMQGDAVTDADLSILLETHQEKSPLATIGVKHVTDEEVSQMAIVVTDQSGADGESGFVESFKEKPTLEEAGSNRLASIGFYVLSAEVMEYFLKIGRQHWEQSGEFDYAFDFFPALLNDHKNSIYALMMPQPFYWSDIGRPDQYIATVRDIYAGRLQINLPQDAHQYFEEGIIYWENSRELVIQENAVLKGNLIIFPKRS